MGKFHMGSAFTSHWHDGIWVALRYLTFGTSALLIAALIGLFGFHKVSKTQAFWMIAINFVAYAALLIRGAMVHSS